MLFKELIVILHFYNYLNKLKTGKSKEVNYLSIYLKLKT